MSASGTAKTLNVHGKINMLSTLTL